MLMKSQNFLGISAAAQRVVRLHNGAVLSHIFLEIRILVQRMIFVLHNSGLDFCTCGHTLKLFRCIVIGNSNGSNFPCGNAVFQSLIDAVVIGPRLMH